MSTTKAYDVSHVRFSAPDLDVMKAFLEDFGMSQVSQSNSKLVMRGHGPSPYCHVTELGEPGFKGFGIWVHDAAGFDALAAQDGAEIVISSEPGGGRMFKLMDPDGFTVEVLNGQEKVDSLPLDENQAWNHGRDYPRQHTPKRVTKGPAHVMRLGHVVLGVSDFNASEAWYKERFGFITSDEIRMGPDMAIGAFMRCDRGDEPCDHHTVFLMQRPIPAGFMHAAFEVIDLDDLMVGHDHLKEKQRTAIWGIGRHILGSQVFDYWQDPWGHEVEHWTDGDQFVAADGGGIGTMGELMGVQWGMQIPPIPGA